MEILKVYARGLIGLKDGIGVDEIEIDIQNNFAHGPIGICSDGNGAGKSTLMELLLQPYNTPLSKPGTVQAQMEDSGGEIHQTYLYKGHEYKFIRSFSGSRAEGFIYKDGSPIYKDGRIRGYEAMIEELFGPFEIFKQIVFVSQNGQRISEIASGRSQSAIKDLLMSALGLDGYKKYEEQAKNVIRAIEDKRYRFDIEYKSALEGIEALKSEIALRGDYQAKLSEVERVISDITATMETIQEGINSVNAKKEGLLKLKEIADGIVAKKAELKERLRALEDKEQRYISARDEKAAGFERRRNQLIELSEKKDEVQRSIAEKDKLTDVLDRLRKVAANIADVKKIQTELRIKEAKRTSIANDIAHIESRWNDKIQRAKSAADLICEVPCNDNPEYCESCKLLDNARAERDKVSAYETQKHAELSEAQAGLEVIDSDYVSTQTLLEEFTNERFPGGMPEAAQIDIEISDVQKKLAEVEQMASKAVDIARAEENLAALDREKATMISGFEEAMSDLKEQVSMVQVEMNGLGEPEYPDMGNLIAESEWLTARKRDMSVELGNALSERDKAIGQLRVLDEKEKELEHRLQTIAGSESTKSKFDNATKDWNVIRRAMGRDGIPALEIEGAAGSITSFANEILDVAGCDFRLRIDTQVENSKGETREGFDIKVLREGREPFDIGLLSGGEKVYPDIAITNAIAVCRRLMSPWAEDIRTQFLDEPGGALTDDNRVKFFDVVCAMHELSGHDMAHTFFVTHDRNVIAQTAQRIELDKKNREYRIIR